MTFADSVKICLDKYATFRGRAPRSEYWWFFVFNWLVVFVAALLFALVGKIINGPEGAAISASAGTAFLALAFFLPNLSVMVRRLHDTGHSGLWYFISFVPVVGGFILLYLLIKDSDDENQYGLPVY